MSTAKVIFTYKRKRLSSHSGVGHADDCADFSLDAQVDKHQDAPIEKLKSPDKDVTVRTVLLKKLFEYDPVKRPSQDINIVWNNKLKSRTVKKKI